MRVQVEHIGDATLYCGDSNDVLRSIISGNIRAYQPRSIDAVVTDPPYGVSYVTNYRKRMATPGMLANDDDAPLWSVDLMAQTMKDGSALYLCTRFDVSWSWSNAIIEAGLQPKTPIFWDKTNWTAGDLDGDFGAQVEIVLFAHKGRHKLRAGRLPNLWTIPRDPPGEHPTPKPVDLMGKMVRCSTDPGDVVLDPFMGGGATGVACARLGRRFIGVELEPKYFELSCRRIEQAQRQGDIFRDIPAAKPKQEVML